MCLPGALPVLPGDRDGVDDAGEHAQADEGDADGVTLGEEGRVARDERVGRDDTADVAEAWGGLLVTGSRSVCQGSSDLPICQALPMALRWCPPRFMLNQHTIMGMAEYVPMQIRNSAAYCTGRLS